MSIAIKFSDYNGKTTQTFRLSSIKTGLVDKCFEMAEKTKEIENKTVTVKEINEYYTEVKTLLSEIFKGHFTYKELQENVTQDEVIICFNSVMEHIGVVLKRKN